MAYRFALAGHEVVIGSRDGARAAEKAEEIAGKAGVPLAGATNAEAAAAADLVLLAVPWAGHGDLVASLAGSLAGKGQEYVAGELRHVLRQSEQLLLGGDLGDQGKQRPGHAEVAE